MTDMLDVYRSYADRTAVGLSTLCALHCLAVPLAMTLYPPAIAMGLGDEAFHLWLLVGVVPVSVMALTLGCRKHRNIFVPGIGALGILVLVAAVFFGHDLVGEWGERLMTLIGASLLAASHIRNFSLCRDHSGCECVN